MTNRKHTFPAPSADMILELIHADPNVESEYLSFYKSYIRAAAVEPVYTADGCCSGSRLNEDLQQGIDIAFVRSLVLLRNNLINYLKGECVLLLIVPPPE